MHLSTDVLVIGAGGAGMYAALEAARTGAKVILADRSLIGRGGATIMVQMTVAVAVGEQEPDHWEHHLADTLAAGRGLWFQLIEGDVQVGGVKLSPGDAVSSEDAGAFEFRSAGAVEALLFDLA